MEQEAFQNFLTTVYQVALDHAQQRAHYHQRLAKWLEWMLISLSSLTTLLMALASFLREFPIALISAGCSAFVTVITIITKSQKPREKCSFYKNLGDNLIHEYFSYKANDEIYQQFEDKDAQFTRRIFALLEDANKQMPDGTVYPIIPAHILLSLQQPEKE
jgi:hypothetical protein